MALPRGVRGTTHSAEGTLTQPSLAAGLQRPLRTGVAAALTVGAASALHVQQPAAALIATVLVMDASPDETRRLALSRLAGTVLGAVIGALLGQFLETGPVSIGLGVLASMSLTELLRLRKAARLAGYTCGIVLFHAGDAPWLYARGRLLETMLGVAMAVLVSSVPMLVKPQAPERQPDLD
jgi:uncharacterized membrane protein YgaE (UPF0421/DUF939 family)